jgi:Glycosyl hydrolases family 38 N-terminal domain
LYLFTDLDLEELNLETHNLITAIKSQSNSTSIKNGTEVVDWQESIQITIAEVKKLSMIIRRNQNVAVGLASRKGVKPVLSEIDLNMQKKRGLQMRDFLFSKKENAFNPKNFVQNETYVYVVPHTHTDLGWLKTLDDYYKEGNIK